VLYINDIFNGKSRLLVRGDIINAINTIKDRNPFLKDVSKNDPLFSASLSLIGCLIEDELFKGEDEE
jgi:hypothetical protein